MTDARDLLTFRLGDEDYGIDILAVREIRGLDAVTRLPGAPAFVTGVVNLRGVIVPVVDMRLRLGLPADASPLAVMVVLEVAGRLVAMVVDAVDDVLALDPASLRPVPDVAGAIDRRFLRGLAPMDARMLIVLDIEALMTSQGMGLIEAALAA